MSRRIHKVAKKSPRNQASRARMSQKFWYGRNHVSELARSRHLVPSICHYCYRNYIFPADCRLSVIEIRRLELQEAQGSLLWSWGWYRDCLHTIDIRAQGLTIQLSGSCFHIHDRHFFKFKLKQMYTNKSSQTNSVHTGTFLNVFQRFYSKIFQTFLWTSWVSVPTSSTCFDSMFPFSGP